MTSDLPPAAAGTTHPGSLRVLVADDYDVARKLMRRALERVGITDVDDACDGQEAVDLLAVNRYDLLLLDLRMPRLTGTDVVRWLNAHPDRLEGLSIVVISASAREERPVLNELGVTLLLPKPFRRDELADLVRNLTTNRPAT